MDTKWINRQENAHLIIFFNGWGMDDHVLSRMNHGEFDVLMIYNYTSLNLTLPSLQNYQQVSLIAWSMGVWAATQSSIKCNMAIAINGTPTPMNAITGIDPMIFTATHQHWNENNRLKFNMRVCGGRATWMAQKELFPTRALDDQKKELQAIANHCQKQTNKRQWHKAIIGSGDAIFLPCNQHQAWRGTTPHREISMPHWPFHDFNNWQTILDL